MCVLQYITISWDNYTGKDTDKQSQGMIEWRARAYPRACIHHCAESNVYPSASLPTLRNTLRQLFSLYPFPVSTTTPVASENWIGSDSKCGALERGSRRSRVESRYRIERHRGSTLLFLFMLFFLSYIQRDSCYYEIIKFSMEIANHINIDGAIRRNAIHWLKYKVYRHSRAA